MVLINGWTLRIRWADYQSIPAVNTPLPRSAHPYCLRSQTQSNFMQRMVETYLTLPDYVKKETLKTAARATCIVISF